MGYFFPFHIKTLYKFPILLGSPTKSAKNMNQRHKWSTDIQNPKNAVKQVVMPASEPPPVKRLEIRNPTVSITILIPKLQDPGSEQNATQHGPVCIPKQNACVCEQCQWFQHHSLNLRYQLYKTRHNDVIGSLDLSNIHNAWKQKICKLPHTLTFKYLYYLRKIFVDVFYLLWLSLL